jgi:hypothetical protein
VRGEHDRDLMLESPEEHGCRSLKTPDTPTRRGISRSSS